MGDPSTGETAKSLPIFHVGVLDGCIVGMTLAIVPGRRHGAGAGMVCSELSSRMQSLHTTTCRQIGCEM